MTKVELMNKFTRAYHRVGFKLKKHSPELLIVGGVTGLVGAAVMACKATTELEAVLENAKNRIDAVNEAMDHPETLPEGCTVDDRDKLVKAAYIKTGFELIKLYGPAVTVGAVSIAAIFTGGNILRKRNLALAAAYATVDGTFKDYRGRLIERFGKELDRELLYDVKTQEVEETVTNEDGSETTVTKTVNVVDPKTKSGYARCFDETCSGWTRDAEYNLMFLVQQQNYANEKLQSRGYLFLNEVYDMLGMQASRAGQSVGWVYDKDNKIGDNYVDFGIHDLHDENKRLFVNGYEKSIWLDFNVDGDILSLMP
jgi:hypothetical protein